MLAPPTDLLEIGLSMGSLPDTAILEIKTKANTFWLIEDGESSSTFIAETTHPELPGVQRLEYEGATLEDQPLGCVWICKGARMRMRLPDNRVLVTSPIQTIRVVMDPERARHIRHEAGRLCGLV